MKTKDSTHRYQELGKGHLKKQNENGIFAHKMHQFEASIPIW